MPKNLSEQISCVEREIKIRRRVYGRRVDEGRMTQHAADHEIECMQAVLETLRAVKDYLGAHVHSRESNEALDRMIEACGNEQGEMF